jgi:hypothetical protein
MSERSALALRDNPAPGSGNGLSHNTVALRCLSLVPVRRQRSRSGRHPALRVPASGRRCLRVNTIPTNTHREDPGV